MEVQCFAYGDQVVYQTKCPSYVCTKCGSTRSWIRMTHDNSTAFHSTFFLHTKADCGRAGLRQSYALTIEQASFETDCDARCFVYDQLTSTKMSLLHFNYCTICNYISLLYVQHINGSYKKPYATRIFWWLTSSSNWSAPDMSMVIDELCTCNVLQGWPIQSNYHYFQQNSLGFAPIGLEPLSPTPEA